jgi:hypothetical protein
VQLTRAFTKIADPKVRRKIIDLVKSLAAKANKGSNTAPKRGGSFGRKKHFKKIMKAHRLNKTQTMRFHLFTKA